MRAAWILLALAGCGGAGAKGDPGGKGDPGPAGMDGTNGVNGMNGADGANGANGMNGTNGVDATADMTAPQQPLRLWVSERAGRHYLNWELSPSPAPKIASVRIYRSNNSINLNTDFAEAVIGSDTSAEIDLHADSGVQLFAVSAVSAAGVEGPISNAWIQNTESRIAFPAHDGTSAQYAWVKSIAFGPAPSPTKIDGSQGSAVTLVKFSPDGMRVAFVGGINNGGDLWVKNADGSGTAIRLNEPAFDAAHSVDKLEWSPDGRFLWFHSRKSDKTEQALWLASSSAASSAVKVTNLPSKADDRMLEPTASFTADGKRLVYGAPRAASPTKCELFTVPVALPLGTATAISGAVPPVGGANTLYGAFFALPAPDSRAVFFINAVPQTTDANDYNLQRVDAYVVPLVGGGAPVLVGSLGGLDDLSRATASAAWSPSGQTVAFTGDANGDKVTDRILRATAGGNGVYTVLDSFSASNAALTGTRISKMHGLQWLPDEDRLFVSLDDAAGFVNAGGGGFDQITNIENGLVLSPDGSYVAGDSSGILVFTDLGAPKDILRGSLLSDGGLAPQFRWLSDGQRVLAVNSNGDLVVAHADVPINTALVDASVPLFNNTGSTENFDIQRIDVSPLGQRVRTDTTQP